MVQLSPNEITTALPTDKMQDVQYIVLLPIKWLSKLQSRNAHEAHKLK